MNKIIVKVAMICALLACLGVSAMRKDTPGVAQRKLKLMIQNAEKNPLNDRQIKQLLNDISPSLKEDYSDMIEQIRAKKPNAPKEKESVINIFENKIAIFIKLIKTEDFDINDTEGIIVSLLEDNKLSNDDKEKFKIFANEIAQKEFGVKEGEFDFAQDHLEDEKLEKNENTLVKELEKKQEKLKIEGSKGKENIKIEDKGKVGPDSQAEVKNLTSRSITLTNNSPKAIVFSLYHLNNDKNSTSSPLFNNQRNVAEYERLLNTGKEITIEYKSHEKQTPYALFKYDDEKTPFQYKPDQDSIKKNFPGKRYVELDDKTEYTIDSLYNQGALIVSGDNLTTTRFGLYTLKDKKLNNISKINGIQQMYGFTKSKRVEIPLPEMEDNCWLVKKDINGGKNVVQFPGPKVVLAIDDVASSIFKKYLSSQGLIMINFQLTDKGDPSNLVIGYNITDLIKKGKDKITYINLDKDALYVSDDGGKSYDIYAKT